MMALMMEAMTVATIAPISTVTSGVRMPISRSTLTRTSRPSLA